MSIFGVFGIISVSKIPPADTMGYYIFRMEDITPSKYGHERESVGSKT